jgi:glycosyltransferase involved in cell wall biosynthesis
MRPFISICIPAYKRVQYLSRLLDSILVQTFKDYEIVLSDDSDDDSVQNLCDLYAAKLPIGYFRNKTSLGTPANWNFAISKAKGEWIKLIHDDDWFATPASLELFAASARSVNKKFIFSAYNNYFESEKRYKEEGFPFGWKQRIIRSPVTLLAHNVVGPPSVTLIHQSIREIYDERMKWRVDMDFYMQLLTNEKDYYRIDKVLINVGVSDSQVTNSCINVPSVELPEGYLLLKKHGVKALSHILVYDAWWRLLRNMKIFSKEQLNSYVENEWPPVILKMVKHLSACPSFVLNNGITSKFAMVCSYCINYFTTGIKD